MRPNRSNRIILFTIVLILVLLAFAYYLFLRIKSDPVNSSEIALSDMMLYDQDFSAQCTFVSSGKSFRKYDYSIVGETMYLTIFGGLVSADYPTGDFTIWIQDDFKDVKKVVLKSGEKEELIFER